MAVNKWFYAVRVGKVPGIYRTWDECQLQVTGYKGAEFKKFVTLEEAKQFMKAVSPYSNLKYFDNLSDDEMIAYIDGSFNVRTQEFGYGVVIFTSEGKRAYSGKGNDDHKIVHRNVAGEIYAAVFAMKKALQDNKRHLYLHYDYTGIEKWANGDWKTNYKLTEYYKKYYNEIKPQLHVHFIKIKAHSGDPYNDEADLLARTAIENK